MQRDLKSSIAIFGPTASGKTKLGVALAKTFLGEVVSVDSLQCYRPGSIVTAKPRAEEMQNVPHHMIDYLEADEEPHNFISMAAEKMDEIASRGKLPILVGGSTSLTIPLLLEASKRRYRMVVVILVPSQSTYQSLIQARANEMLEMGLLDELIELKHLQQTLLGDKPNFDRGIWKAIGYSEFYSYLQSDAGADEYGILKQNALTSMYVNTLRYGFLQLEWIQHTLMPLLHKERVSCISLPVSDKASWTLDVEGPAISIATEFCHSSPPMWLPSKEMPKHRVACLFGGASSGNDPAHIEAAKALAHALHRYGIKLVYGGGTTGIMGAISGTLVELSGPNAVHGIIPAALARYEEEVTKECADPSRFGTRTVVRDMHTRKRLMVKSVLDGAPGSGFVALSGGYGTMEELLEVTTWYQLGIHGRSVCIFNVSGFYDGLLHWISKVVRDGFVDPKDAGILRVAASADEVVSCLGDNHLGSRIGELEWI